MNLNDFAHGNYAINDTRPYGHHKNSRFYLEKFTSRKIMFHYLILIMFFKYLIKYIF